jgi:hypothetical protein
MPLRTVMPSCRLLNDLAIFLLLPVVWILASPTLAASVGDQSTSLQIPDKAWSQGRIM